MITVKKPSPKMTISDLLDDFKLSSLIKHKSTRTGVLKSILDLHESTPLQKALLELKNADILAAPVFRYSQDFSTKIYIGIVSVHEILSFGFFQDIFDQRLAADNDSASRAINRFKKETFFNTPVKTIVESRCEEPVSFLFSSSDPISRLLGVFANGHHRALVVSAEIVINGIPAESSVTMITQLDLLAYLFDSTQDKVALPADFIEAVMSKSLSQLSLASKRVIAICDYQPALAGFNIMHLNNVHAVPVLNENDMVVSTLSAKDLRGLTIENIGTLIKPAKHFVKITAAVQAFDVVDQSRVRVEDACAFMLKERIHHIWLTNGKIVSGCVTPTDILRLFHRG